jgi:rhodanese-related sulfurtransferase
MGLFDRITGAGIQAKVDEARSDPNAVLLDVRTVDEYARGHIEGAVNIPLDQIDRAATELPGRKLYVHCASGARSRRAVDALKAAGFPDAENIGGIVSWRGPIVADQ